MINFINQRLYIIGSDFQMATRKLSTVSFPIQLLDEVDDLIEQSGKYISRADFCRAAVRQLIIKEEESS